MKNTKNIAIVHGECFLFPSQIPSNSKKMKATNNDYMIVAESEVTGNHHVVDVKDGAVEFFQSEDGRMFMKNDVETDIRCVIKERHDNITLEPNTWEFGTQKEYDHISDELVNVRD